MKRTKCFKCGKIGHMARVCPSNKLSGHKSKDSRGSGNSTFFQFQDSHDGNKQVTFEGSAWEVLDELVQIVHATCVL